MECSAGEIHRGAIYHSGPEHIGEGHPFFYRGLKFELNRNSRWSTVRISHKLTFPPNETVTKCKPLLTLKLTSIDFDAYLKDIRSTNVRKHSRIAEYSNYFKRFIDSAAFKELLAYDSNLADYAGWLFICLFDSDIKSETKTKVDAYFNRFKELVADIHNHDPSIVNAANEEIKEKRYAYIPHIGLTLAVPEVSVSVNIVIDNYKGPNKNGYVNDIIHSISDEEEIDMPYDNWIPEVSAENRAIRGNQYAIVINDPKPKTDDIFKSLVPNIRIIRSPFTEFIYFPWNEHSCNLPIPVQFFTGGLYVYMLQYNKENLVGNVEERLIKTVKAFADTQLEYNAKLGQDHNAIAEEDVKSFIENSIRKQRDDRLRPSVFLSIVNALGAQMAGYTPNIYLLFSRLYMDWKFDLLYKQDRIQIIKSNKAD